MNKPLIIFSIFIILTACEKKIVKPVVIKPKVKKILLEKPVVSKVKIPRLLKIDQKLPITIFGYFNRKGFKVSKHIIKIDGNEIGIYLFGKPSPGAEKNFRYKIILPAQKKGEYDIVAYGKNGHVNDILWVEEYKGLDRKKYLKRLKKRKIKTDNNPDF